MKDNQDIDELLNSFIDGELSARQQTEVQRLVAHDEQVAQRLAELESCKMLVSSLPRAEVPADMTEQIKASLAGKSVPSRQDEGIGRHPGARHLLVRRVLAAAAMIALIVGLVSVVYTIVAPETVTDKPIAVEGWQEPTVTTVEKVIDKPGTAEAGFYARLELKTANPNAVSAFIRKVVEQNGLLDNAYPGGEMACAVSCSRDELSLLLAELQYVWGRFDSAALSIDTERPVDELIVEAITAEQIEKIVNQDDLKNRIRVAKDFAVLNNISEHLPGSGLLDGVDGDEEDFIAIPKPVLTSNRKTVRTRPDRAEEPRVFLTIVVVGDE